MRVYSYGRLTSCPARLWERALSHRGDSRTRRLQQADLVVIGGGAASRPESDILQVISGAEQADQLVLSERGFLRSIGLVPAMPPETMAYGLEEVAVLAKLPGDRVRLLAAFDVIEGTDGRFGFRAIKAASVAARLIAEGNSLAAIVSACNRIRVTLRVSSPLSQFQVRPDDDGNLALCLADGMAELDGQLRLPIDGASSDIEELLSAAEEARSSDEAERLLRRVPLLRRLPTRRFSSNLAAFCASGAPLPRALRSFTRQRSSAPISPMPGTISAAPWNGRAARLKPAGPTSAPLPLIRLMPIQSTISACLPWMSTPLTTRSAGLSDI